MAAISVASLLTADPETLQDFSDVLNPDEEINWKIYVPESYDPKKLAGLAVYVSPTPRGRMPRGWQPVFDERNLIWISADKAGVEARVNQEQDNVAIAELGTDSFTMVNAGASYRFIDDALLLYVRGSNLGDEDARRHTSALKDLVPLAGRAVHLGLRYDF